ncbi:MAG: dephospho-CoA kinase [Sulfurovaceae bacterium]
MIFEHAIALTGGIATGKSSATALLSLYGFRFIDADKIAHAHLDEQKEAIASLFGDEYIKEAKVDRKILGKLIFANKEKKRELEDLLHPIIYDTIVTQSKKNEALGIPYMIDIPLFFESKRYDIKRSLVVYATKEQQLERLMRREGFDAKEALRRIESQMDIEQKRALADYVIDNSGDLKQLQSECERVKDQILSDCKDRE